MSATDVKLSEQERRDIIDAVGALADEGEQGVAAFLLGQVRPEQLCRFVQRLLENPPQGEDDGRSGK